MALLDSFTTIGGKNPVLFEDVIDLTMYDMNDTPWSTNDMEFICNIIYYRCNTIIKSGVYRVKYKDTNNANKETVIFYSKNETYIDIYTLGKDGYFYRWSSRAQFMDSIPTSGEVSDVMNIYLNGLMISDLERKNKAFIYEINSQADFNNTFLNANWSPAFDSSVKFNCSVSANNKNVVIPKNVYRIEGNNNTISNIISFGYSTKVTNYSDRYIYNLKLLNPSNHNDHNNPFKGFINCNNLNNCISNFLHGNANFSNPRTGFYNCYNLINCITNFASGGGGSFVETVNYGFYNCNFLINCKERHSSDGSYYTEQTYIEYINNHNYLVSSCGFVKCTDLINCIGISGDTSSPVTFNYCECKNLYSCISDSYYSETGKHSYSKSFYLCENLYGCYGSRKQLYDGNSSTYLNYSIFYECKNLNNCDCIATPKYHTIFNNCNILKDCTGNMLNCTNVLNIEEILKNQTIYKGPMSIDSDFTKEWRTGENVNFGDTYLLYGGDGISSLKTYNNVNKGYSVKATTNFGDIINIIDVYDSSTQSFEFDIMDEMYIPIINNCKEIIIFNNTYDTTYMCTIYKDNNGSLRIKIYDNINQRYLTSINSFDNNINNYAFMIDAIISSDDKVIWREPGFWDVMSARTGFVTTI